MGVMKTFTFNKMKKIYNQEDAIGREWREFMQHEHKDRHPYNYPLWGVEK